MDSTQALLDHVEDLTDLELAVLLSLVAQHHCLITSTDHLLDDLASELALVRIPLKHTKTQLMLGQIVSDMFNLSYIILERDD